MTADNAGAVSDSKKRWKTIDWEKSGSDSASATNLYREGSVSYFKTGGKAGSKNLRKA